MACRFSACFQVAQRLFDYTQPRVDRGNDPVLKAICVRPLPFTLFHYEPPAYWGSYATFRTQFIKKYCKFWNLAIELEASAY